MRACCFDCGLAYGADGWADFVIDDAVWKEIAPVDGHGLLCVTCMIQRLTRKGMRSNVRGKFTSGPFAMDL